MPDSIYDDINDEAYAAWSAERPDDYDPGNQEPDDVPGPPQGVDPWQPFTCQRCGSVNTAGMPRKCDGCGLVNYGFGDDA